MDYETFYVTPDSIGRNADHRGNLAARWIRPTGVAAAPPAATVVTTAPPPAATAPVYQYPPAYPAAPTAYPMAWGQPAWNNMGWTAPVSPNYVYPPVGVPPSNLASILGGFGDLGSLASIAAQIFAAFLPLPASPTPQDANDSDPATNAAVNSSNLIRYQNALALFARRDQQILTVGSVLKELLKRPGFSALGA